MKSFLKQTAESILQTIGWEQLRQTTLVLPSRRAGLVLKDELLQLQKSTGNHVVYAPQVQTLNQFIDSLSPLYAEDELSTIARLYRLYLSTFNSQLSTDPMPLDLFYGWGRQMLADFTNIDASMPVEEVPSFFSNAISAHELGEWQLDEETENRLRLLLQPTAGPLKIEDKSIRAQYEALWHSLADIYAGLRSELLAAGKGYTGMRARRVVEEWETILPELEGRHFAFVGFNYLLPVEKQIMTLLREAGLASFYWDYISNFQTNSKAFWFTERNRTDLGSLSPERRWGAPRDVSIISCASRAAQAQYVNEWLPAHYTEPGKHVGVVICDENMLEPVIYALPELKTSDENGETVSALINVTKGFPLRSTHPFAQVMRAAEQWTDTIDWDALYRVLDNEESHQLIPNSRQQAAISWHELLHREALFQVRTCVNKLRRLVTEGIEGVTFTPRLTRMLLRRQMESVTMPFHGEPVTDVQVLGVLETRMLDFDSVLLLNVEEGVLPQQQRDSSFIPYYLRKYYHMQTSDERATVYAYNFFRLVSRADDTTLLYTPAEANPDSKGLSRFVWQMEASDEFVLHHSRLIEQSRVESPDLFCETGKTCTLRHLSPSAISTYISCPRKFYWRYVENIQPTEREEAVFAVNVLGSFVHALLQSVYRDECGCDGKLPREVLAEQIRAIIASEEKMQEALRKAYEVMNAAWQEKHPDDPQPHYIAGQHVIENEAIVRYASYALAHDAELAETEGLQIWQLEQWSNLSLEIEDIGTVTTGGIVDRIDILGRGDNTCMRIVDYKSGSFNARKMQSAWDELTNDEEKAYVLQTLLYCAAVEANGLRLIDNIPASLQPNLYFCKRPLQRGETQLEVDGAIVNDFADVKVRFLSLLKSKIHEMLTSTEFPQQTATKECPEHCPFLLLCGRKC